MSEKFYREKTVGIAWINNEKTLHKGLSMTGKLITKLISKNNANKNFARLYAICIFLIIKDNISMIRKMIICNDEEFSKVKKDLEDLIKMSGIYQKIEIKSITEYRAELGNRKISSPADNYAAAYRKRAHKKTAWKRGIQLNPIEINYEILEELWLKLENSE